MFGGKGGVGKTTCASSTALSLAKDGFDTLIVSTDPAHSIADVYDTEVESNPTQVFNDLPLYAREVDPEKRFNENYSGTARAIMNEASKFGLDIDGDDFTGFSDGVIGSDEAAVIDMFAEYDEDDKWDYIIFDTAPTGHTLRMLQLPDVLDSVVGTALNFKKRYDSIKGRVTSIVPGTGGDEEGKDLEDVDIEETRNKLERVADMLRDSRKTQFYAVMEAEELSLQETERLIAQLDENDISIGGIFVNKVLTDEITENCEFFKSRQENQQEIIGRVESQFDLPVLQLPLQKDPPRGEDLHSIADRINVS